MESVFVTGAAGFVGYHLVKRLLSEGYLVYGVDDLNDYYDVSLKRRRLNLLLEDERFVFEQINIAEKKPLEQFFVTADCQYVVHLAAQAGVRYSLEYPEKYVEANILGTTNILECCRQRKPQHFIYASSSSVYGESEKFPFREDDDTSCPISFYAATKKAAEVMARSYAHLYQIPTTGLRFFTIYGPWGRPDMALFKFTRSIVESKPLELFNGGELYRDFTYVDDVVRAINLLLSKPPASLYEIYNVGRGEPVKMQELVHLLESVIGEKAMVLMAPMQAGDVYKTSADITKLKTSTGWLPIVDIEEGILKFFEWYKSFYDVK